MLLTIGIPVYNGEKYIATMLESVLKLGIDPSLMEIIVSDNVSSDNTCKIVNGFPDVKLYTHTQNVGFDGNVDRIFHYAAGAYVWIIGADDLVATDDIDEILSAIVEDKFGVIFVGESNQINGGIENTAESFLINSNFRSGFVSNNIIKKTLWNKIDKKRFLKSAWIHFAMVLQIIKLAPSYLTSRKYVVEQENDEPKTWNNKGVGVLTSLKLVEIFEEMSTWGYDDEYIKKAKMVIKGGYPRVLVQARIEGLAINRDILKRFIRFYAEFPSFWYIDIWALLIPSWIFKFVFGVYKFFK